MTFYERYEKLCGQRGIEPCSQKAADMLSTTKATISTWKKSNSIPQGKTIKVMADALGVSADYLLGRTDDPIDYADASWHKKRPFRRDREFGFDTNSDENSQKEILANYMGRTDTPQQMDIADNAPEAQNQIVKLCAQLDDIDRIRVEAYVEGMLTADKYRKKTANPA